MQAFRGRKGALESRVYIRDWSSFMFALFPAQLSEVDVCYALIDQGRAFQRKQGFVQWTDDYPQREHVADDIKTGKGYALKDEAGRIAGYICIDFGGEPAYDAIKGQWRSKEPS